MLFETTEPLTSGYFQCDLSTQRPPRDIDRHAGLLYVTSGQGVWTVGPWTFPVRRGDLFAIPAGVKASAELNPTRPLGYYYCYFGVNDSSSPRALAWPWRLGDSGVAAAEPCASGEFRPELAANFRAIQYELGRKTTDATLAARAHLAILGVSFARMLALKMMQDVPINGHSQANVPYGKGLPESVACVVDYVLAHLEKDLSVAELAGVARCSERRLVDIFRNAMGTSPMAYVRERRVFEAQKLLVQGLAVKEVANRLNFADSHHFSRVFRQKTGISPSEYAAGKAPLRQQFVGEFCSTA
jgi:AraC-like DNA-binding protein